MIFLHISITKSLKPYLIVSVELQELEREGFGSLVTTSKKSLQFMKPHPDTLMMDDKILKSAKISLDQYAINFNWVVDLDESLKNSCLYNHPQHELIIDLLTPDDIDS